MSTIRAVCTFANDSGLPEDSVVNRFHFDTAISPAPSGDLTEIFDRLQTFYTSIDQWFSTELTGAWTVTMYDMGDPEPRVPLEEFTGQALTVGSDPAYPNEVAIVLSFQAEPVSGVNQARRRNRVFLGPLSASAGANSTGDVRPGSPIRNDLVSAASALLAANDVDVEWVVRSETSGATADVDNGWIDDAFDTQRRRGRRATTRSVFP